MALAAILLIDPENGDQEGFCSSLCKFSIFASNALTGGAHVIMITNSVAEDQSDTNNQDTIIEEWDLSLRGWNIFHP